MFCLLVLMTVPSFLGRSVLFCFVCAVTFISLPFCSVFFVFSDSLKLSKLFAYGKLLRALMSLFTLWTLFVSSQSCLTQGDQGWLQNPDRWHNNNLCDCIIIFSEEFPLDPPSVCEALNNPTKSLGFLFLSWVVWTYRPLRDRTSANYLFISGKGKG